MRQLKQLQIMDEKEIGQILKQRRVGLGWSQTKVAAETDLNVVTVNNFENGKLGTLKNLLLICKVLDLKLEFIRA